MRLQNTGLLIHDEERATQGFTLFSPLMQDQVYLLDMRGDVVHEWTVNGNAYGFAYLLPNGNLLASALAPDIKQEDREGMRHILELDWNGKIIWQCEAPGQHHDFVRLANGNTSFLGFERLSSEAVGRVRGGHGHMAMLPVGAAYQFQSDAPSVVMIQTIQGPLTQEKWNEICQTQ